MSCKRKNCPCIGVDRKRENPPGMKYIACSDGKPPGDDLKALRMMAWFIHDRSRARGKAAKS